jgi:hypothetical protein
MPWVCGIVINALHGPIRFTAATTNVIQNDLATGGHRRDHPLG